MYTDKIYCFELPSLNVIQFNCILALQTHDGVSSSVYFSILSVINSICSIRVYMRMYIGTYIYVLCIWMLSTLFTSSARFSETAQADA